VIYCRASTERK